MKERWTRPSREVDQGRAQICFLLNAVSVETVAEMAMAGEVLPQKSTDFFPKLMSGITMYPGEAVIVNRDW